jgi:recombination protein RecA
MRDRIGRIPLPPETPGGRALKHFASVRVFLRNDGPIKVGEGTIGSKVEFTIKKNKVGPPYGAGAFEIWNDRGVCIQGGVLDLAIELGLIKQKGAWFIYKDKAMAQGRVAAINALTNKELYSQIMEEIKSEKASIGNKDIPAGSVQEYSID